MSLTQTQVFQRPTDKPSFVDNIPTRPQGGG
jgi:hypothetical protein